MPSLKVQKPISFNLNYDIVFHDFGGLNLIQHVKSIPKFRFSQAI